MACCPVRGQGPSLASAWEPGIAAAAGRARRGGGPAARGSVAFSDPGHGSQVSPPGGQVTFCRRWLDEHTLAPPTAVHGTVRSYRPRTACRFASREALRPTASSSHRVIPHDFESPRLDSVSEVCAIAPRQDRGAAPVIAQPYARLRALHPGAAGLVRRLPLWAGGPVETRTTPRASRPGGVAPARSPFCSRRPRLDAGAAFVASDCHRGLYGKTSAAQADTNFSALAWTASLRAAAGARSTSTRAASRRVARQRVGIRLADVVASARPSVAGPHDTTRCRP